MTRRAASWLAWAVALTAVVVVQVPARAATLASQPTCQPSATHSAGHCTRTTHGLAIPTWQIRMLDAVNTLRWAAGVPPVRLCPELTAAAQDYAQTMASTGHYGHVGADGSQPWDRMKAHGYTWRGAAENIAAGYSKVPVVMEAWHASEGHYVNLVNPSLRHVGFGKATASGSPMGTYWVQDFAFGDRCD